MKDALVRKRILVIPSAEFMGPVPCEVFREQGAMVGASAQAFRRAARPAQGSAQTVAALHRIAER